MKTLNRIKSAPDRVESIMKPTGPAKEELHRILMKMNQFKQKITNIGVCTFEMSRKITGSANIASETII